METTTRDELKSTNYELFILALSILSLFNWVSYFILKDIHMARVILIVDGLLSLIFLADFLYRLSTAQNKATYFLRQFGWLDLLSSLPAPMAKIFRLGRVIRLIRLMHAQGLRQTTSEFLVQSAGSAVYLVFVLIVLVLEFGSIAILAAERSAPNAVINTASDAVWWAIVTMSTVGYGDTYPVTNNGRVVAILVIVVGVALFGVVTGFLANAFNNPREQEQRSRTIEPGSEEPATILEEITRLRQAQEEANAEFSSHLARLVARLEQAEQ
ncbi:MAG TPA: potassium channel family protein [Anaerolineae bacterium]|jgi:voltage-gated potassium channel|nr:potassium channel family protein [Anaerolineae bacterium]